MKRNILLGLAAITILASCNNDKKIINSIQQYNTEMESEGFHMGDKIQLPEDVTKNAEKISISFGYAESDDLTIDPKYFTLGENDVTYRITTKNGKVLNQDATINVFASEPEKDLSYDLVAEYPHDTRNFVQGFQLVGNTIYESDGQNGQSRLIKYTLGETQPLSEVVLDRSIFAEGSTIAGDKIFQLTWRNGKGFIYDLQSFEQIEEFKYPSEMVEGWGLTYDGENLIASDGTSNLYFLDVNQPSKLLRKIGVAGNSLIYSQLNELEYHEGYIYANIWQQPIIVKIDPKSGAVVERYNFSDIAKNHTSNTDDVLNGITFKGENMLITGKNWSKIYEVKIK